MKSALVWIITQRRVVVPPQIFGRATKRILVIPHRRFGTAFRSRNFGAELPLHSVVPQKSAVLSYIAAAEA